MSNNIIIKHCCCGSNFEQQEDVRWGNITGRIQDQGDLMDYINAALVGGDVDLQDYAKKDWVLQEIANIHIPEGGLSVAEVNVLIGNALDSYDTSSVVDEKVAQASAQTMQVVDSRGYLTEHQSLEGYATEDLVNQKVSEIPTTDLSDYYTSEQTDEAIAQATASTIQEVESKGYLTEHQDISGKQDVITDLDSIREGAEKGMTAIQEHQSLEGYATESYVQEQIALIPTGGTGGGSSASSSPLLEGNKMVCFHIKTHYEWDNFWEITVDKWIDNPLVTSLKLNGKEITEGISGNFYEGQDMGGNVAIVEVEFNTGDLSSMGSNEYMGINLGNAVVLGTGITKVPELFFQGGRYYYVYQCAPEIAPTNDGYDYVQHNIDNGGYPIVWYLPNRDANGGSIWDYNHTYSNGVSQKGRLYGYEPGAKINELPVTNVVSVVQHAYINIKGMAERLLWLDDIKKAINPTE